MLHRTLGRRGAPVVVLLAFLYAPAVSGTEAPRVVPAPAAPRAAPGEILVQFDPRLAPVRRRAALDRIGARFHRRGYRNTFEVIAVPTGRAFDAALAQLRRTPGIRIAEPNYYVYASAVVNDPYFRPYQWNFADTGFGIRAERAWDFSTGTGVTVAVIDTGVAYEDYGGLTAAPDLANTRFVPGFDFVDYDSHPQDLNGHGTHVAGTLAQSTNNGMGCAGVAHGAAIMPIRVLDKDGVGTMDQVASGIRYAADHGAKVINLSLGGATGSSALASAIEYAASRDVVIVAAAGNKGSAALEYPANYPEVIAVGATRFDGQLTAYSNYGPELDVVAPGGDLKVDQNGDGYPDGILQQMPVPGRITSFNLYFMHGTSMATPHVAGIAALVRSRRPEWSAALVREAIEMTCRDLGPSGKDATYGYGLVDAAAAVEYLPPDRTPPSAPTGLEVTASTAETVSLEWKASTDNVGVAGYRVYRDGAVAASVTGTTFTDTGRKPATTYQYQVVAYDAADNVSAFSNRVTATTLAGPPTDVTPPTAPTGLTATAVTSGSVSLTWNAATDDLGVDRYTVYRNGTPIGSTAATSLTDTSVTPSSVYEYTVLAFDAANNASPAAAPITVVIPAPAPPPDGSIFHFEDGTLQGWQSASYRASLWNSGAEAYLGSRSLRVRLFGVSTRSKAVIFVNLGTGAPAPSPGQTVRLRLYPPPGSRFMARAVLFDRQGIPYFGDYVPLTEGGWRELTVALPGYAAGPADRLELQIGTSFGTGSGDLYLDSVTW